MPGCHYLLYGKIFLKSEPVSAPTPVPTPEPTRITVTDVTGLVIVLARPASKILDTDNPSLNTTPLP
jgi:hypothetical protein